MSIIDFCHMHDIIFLLRATPTPGEALLQLSVTRQEGIMPTNNGTLHFGTVTEFHGDKKGYGYIQLDGTSNTPRKQQVWFHIAAFRSPRASADDVTWAGSFSSDSPKPVRGMRVAFEVERNAKGARAYPWCLEDDYKKALEASKSTAKCGRTMMRLG